MEQVSIVEAKRALSRIVNRAAFGKTPIVLTSRGRPKAVLIGHEEYLKLSAGSGQRLVRLGGRWSMVPQVSARELRELRAQLWGKMLRR